MSYDQIQHIFVLMLENRSFDHLLGFSGISGTDPASGLPTTVTDCRNGAEHLLRDALHNRLSCRLLMVVDPGHELPDVLCQLAGSAAVYPAGGNYPSIDNSGFVVARMSRPASKANQQILPAKS